MVINIVFYKYVYPRSIFLDLLWGLFSLRVGGWVVFFRIG